MKTPLYEYEVRLLYQSIWANATSGGSDIDMMGKSSEWCGENV